MTTSISYKLHSITHLSFHIFFAHTFSHSFHIPDYCPPTQPTQHIHNTTHFLFFSHSHLIFNFHISHFHFHITFSYIPGPWSWGCLPTAYIPPSPGPGNILLYLKSKSQLFCFLYWSEFWILSLCDDSVNQISVWIRSQWFHDRSDLIFFESLNQIRSAFLMKLLIQTNWWIRACFKLSVV